MAPRDSSSLWQRIRQRKLAQWGAAYLAGAWVALQLFAILGATFEWSPALQRLLVVVLAAGLPAALALGWYHGEQGRQRVGTGEILVFAGLLLVAGVGLALLRQHSPGTGGVPAAGMADSPTRVAEESIAVLPFVNMSPDPGNAYFSDGISEEIINALARIGRLKVAARTSSFFYQGRKVPLRRIGAELGVRYVLEGSVRRVGDRVRITAQLIDAADGYHLWSQTYERTLEDIFAIQAEIAAAVARALELEITGSSRWATAGETGDLEARESYYRALFIYNDAERFRTDTSRALELFRAAAAADPEFALARATLASALCTAAVRGLLRPDAVLDEARAEAERALQLAPDLDESHIARGNVAMVELDWFTMRDAMQRAVTLNPNSPRAHARLSIAATYFGRWDEALRHSRIATKLDPVNAGVIGNYAEMLNILHRPGDAARALRDALALDPSLASLLPALARSLVLAGDGKGALDAALRFREAEASTDAALTLAYVHATGGRSEAARSLLREVPDLGGEHLVIAVMTYAALGEQERALALTERAVAEVPLIFALYAYLPELDPLRGEPRFRDALAALNIPDPDPPPST